MHAAFTCGRGHGHSQPSPLHTRMHEQRHVSSTPVSRMPLEGSKMPTATESEEEEGREPSGECGRHGG
jgi:hypothetical protein